MLFSRNPSTGVVECYTDDGEYIGVMASMGDTLEDDGKTETTDGGEGSGNFNHEGRPGHRGGSGGGGSSGSKSRPKKRIPVDGRGISYTRPRARNVSKREASKIGHEINTNYSKYEGLKIGWHISYSPEDDKAYNYYFENHGFGEYNIFKKTRNKG